MKNITLLIMLSICFSTLGCKDSSKANVSASDVPAPVISTFNARYPGAQDARWEKKKVNDNNIFEAEFKLDNKDKEVKISEDGAFIGEDDD